MHEDPGVVRRRDTRRARALVRMTATALLAIGLGGTVTTLTTVQADAMPAAAKTAVKPKPKPKAKPRPKPKKPKPKPKPKPGVVTPVTVSDSGFRPATDGFSFPNYGTDDGTGARHRAPVNNLTSAEMIKLFGETSAICGPGEEETCALTPAAQDWMDHENTSMNEGHCNGMAVMSSLLWNKTWSPDDYNALTTPALGLPGNVALQRQLAYAFSFQDLRDLDGTVIRGLTPNQMLDKLIQVLKPGVRETYVLGVYGDVGGHAVTPYAVRNMGGGKYDVLTYDNNFPRTVSTVHFDRNANTYSYVGGTNPQAPAYTFTGTADDPRIDLSPNSVGLGTHPFVQRSQFQGARLDTAGDTTEVYLDGGTDHGHLVLTDDAGNQTGVVGGKVVNKIPGAVVRRSRDGLLSEPTYLVPAGTHFTVTVDGTALQADDPATTVGIIGPAFNMRVKNIDLKPGRRHTIDPAADGGSLAYTSPDAQSPAVELGADRATSDVDFKLGAQLTGPGTFTVQLPKGGEQLGVRESNPGSNATFSLDARWVTATGEGSGSIPSTALAPGDTATLDFSSWDTTGKQIGAFTIQHQ